MPLANHQPGPASPLTGPVIEELTVTMRPDQIADYLALDAEVWTAFLESCDGFLGKEVWRPVDRPDSIVLIIRWSSMAHWKSITPDQVAEVDKRMGDLLPDTLTCRAYQAV